MDQTAPAPSPAAPASQHPVRLSWLHPSGLVSLSFVNFVLRILTLGIYNFWGKTEVRKRIWSGVRLEGEPLQYTGTGKELFLGFLIVFGLIIVPIMLTSVAAAFVFGQGSAAYNLYMLALYAVIFYLVGYGFYRAQRYRLSRTTWRGIRGSLVGDGKSYAWTYFWTALLIPFTAGWIVPWRSTKLQGLITRDMRFGDRPFSFTATSGPLYGRFAVAWVGTIAAMVVIGIGFGMVVASDAALAVQVSDDTPPQPGALTTAKMVALILAFYLIAAIVGAWYHAGQFNHFADNTHYERASFSGTMGAGGLIWLTVTNVLIVVLTLGLLTPIAQARAARFMVENLKLDGTVPLAEIAQSAEQGPTRGEGLAQAFDVDAF